MNIVLEKTFLKKSLSSIVGLQELPQLQFTEELLQDQTCRKLYEMASWYYTKYQNLMSADTLQLLLDKSSKIDAAIKERVFFLFTELQSTVDPLDQNIKFVVDQLKDERRKDLLKETLLVAANNFESGRMEESLLDLKKGINKIELNIKEDIKEGYLHESSDQRWDRYQDVKNNPDKFKGIPIGFPSLDMTTNGIRAGQLMVVIAGSKEGKCVQGNTLLFTDKGIIPISKVAAEVNSSVDKFVKYKINLSTKDGIKPTSHFYNAGMTSTIKLQSRFGFEVEGTQSHPLLTMNKNASLVYKNLDEIKLGDFICIQRGQEVWGSSVDLSDFKATPKGTCYRDHKIPTKMTKELARLLGYLIAEGHTTSRAMSFANMDPFVVKDFNRCAKKCFGVNWKKSGVASYNLSSEKVWQFLQYCGLTKDLSAGKEIPHRILTAPKEIVVEFLKAYFEGDGCIDSATTVSSCSISEKLTKQLHIVLTNLGIIGKRRSDFRSATNTIAKRRVLSWSLIIRGKNIDKFANAIGFISPRKKSGLQKLLDLKKTKIAKSNVDVIPFLKEVLSREGVSCPHRNKTKGITYEYLPQIMYKISGNLLSQVDAIVKHNFFFDEVVSLTPGMANTYDFTVPEVHNFISNGIVSHNSTFLLNSAYHASTIGYKVLYVSVEMPKEQIERRYDCRDSGLSYSRIRDARLTRDEERIYQECLTRQKARPGKFYTLDAHDCNTSYLKSKLLSFPYKFDLVVIDYLTLVKSSKAGNSNKEMWQTVGDITYEVRDIARELNIPIITAAQANRDGMKESKYKYGIENIGLSHLISTHADTLISLRLVDRDELEVNDVVEMTAATIAVRDDRACRFTIDACFDKMLLVERQLRLTGDTTPSRSY